jgi:hypothetical protein
VIFYLQEVAIAAAALAAVVDEIDLHAFEC